MDLSEKEYESLHDNAFEDDHFINDLVSAKATSADHRTWAEFSAILPPGPLLEVGPGTGHLLAAARDAGREVWALEWSSTHRAFIRRTWGIDTTFATADELPKIRFGAVLMFNTIEHVYDVGAMMTGLRDRLASNGGILVSTCNARCVILPVVRTYWSMFKQPDHVSIPSAEGFRRLAARTGMNAERVWTGEMPLETPIGLAVAARDFVQERVFSRPEAPTRVAAIGHETSPSEGPVRAATRAARAVMNGAKAVDPTRHLTARLGVAASVRGFFRAI